ncbi:SET domain-containing protein-lysine N-methyltransferase [Niabella soli]|uniref:SET domain-containing protein n=1 Tax=Niabella soli DSM 19437 TaxID=929713 RepID=W0F2N3_9BACT|nr:SET domain-containing protein-lysine N-methyltransferase [Niabella soli]AHF17277.1 hypothetical protein NIASO_05080 [Niabella soli DSM 19437]
MFFKKQHIEKALAIKAGPSKIHGTGVFAKASFSPGAIIEKVPLILLDATERSRLQYTPLFDHYFLLDHAQTPVALALGMASLYKHAAIPNAAYTILLKKGLLVVKAIALINQDEEITINYHGNTGNKNDEATLY